MGVEGCRISPWGQISEALFSKDMKTHVNKDLIDHLKHDLHCRTAHYQRQENIRGPHKELFGQWTKTTWNGSSPDSLESAVCHVV